MDGHAGRRFGLALGGAALLACGAASALQQGITPEGRLFVTGGVSDSEAAALQSRRSEFSLWIVTAARRSGAYLADARVTITSEARQRVVFDGSLDGPWLMVDLPLGRYIVEARSSGQVQRQVTTIHAGDHHQMVFHFDTGDEVLGSER
jgi:glucose/arabinose dehydrogenase